MPSRDPYGRKGPSLNEMLLSSQSATVQETNQHNVQKEANNLEGINKKNFFKLIQIKTFKTI